MSHTDLYGLDSMLGGVESEQDGVDSHADPVRLLRPQVLQTTWRGEAGAGKPGRVPHRRPHRIVALPGTKGGVDVLHLGHRH